MSRFLLIALSSLLLTAAQAMTLHTNNAATQVNGATVADIDTQHQGTAEAQRHRHRHHHRRRR